MWYDICLLMDSDLSHEESNKQALRTNGTSVFDWDSPNALEEQVFLIYQQKPHQNS